MLVEQTALVSNCPCACLRKMPQRTLQVSVCREDGQVVAEESLWALRGLLGPGPLHMDMDTPAVREVRLPQLLFRGVCANSPLDCASR